MTCLRWRAAGINSTVQSTPLSKYLISKYESIVRAAPENQLPTAWMERAMHVERADTSFISLFDGARGAINKSAAAFGLTGLPPVDIACASSPLNMQDEVHLASLISIIASKRPTLVIISPVCRAWCKATDFASRCPIQMKRLIIERAAQTKLIVGVVDLIRAVIAYGGHILMENPTHFKFWAQPFMSEIEAAVETQFNSRSFLLN